MSNIKERILGAVTVMSDDDAQIVWEVILEHFASNGWDSIKDEQPDEWDLEMLDDISKNPECHEFISAKDLEKELGL